MLASALGCMLQFLQYATTVFALVEFVLLVHALIVICKTNYRHPINEKKFRTYDEYRSLQESIKAERQAQQRGGDSVGGDSVADAMSNYDQGFPPHTSPPHWLNGKTQQPNSILTLLFL